MADLTVDFTLGQVTSKIVLTADENAQAIGLYKNEGEQSSRLYILDVMRKSFDNIFVKSTLSDQELDAKAAEIVALKGQQVAIPDLGK